LLKRLLIRYTDPRINNESCSAYNNISFLLSTTPCIRDEFRDRIDFLHQFSRLNLRMRLFFASPLWQLPAMSAILILCHLQIVSEFCSHNPFSLWRTAYHDPRIAILSGGLKKSYKKWTFYQRREGIFRDFVAIFWTISSCPPLLLVKGPSCLKTNTAHLSFQIGSKFTFSNHCFRPWINVQKRTQAWGDNANCSGNRAYIALQYFPFRCDWESKSYSMKI
jgi:hypothetical protein